MKLGSVTKFDKRNKTTSKKFEDDLMPETFDFVIIFSIHGKFGAIRKPDSGWSLKLISSLTVLKTELKNL